MVHDDLSPIPKPHSFASVTDRVARLFETTSDRRFAALLSLALFLRAGSFINLEPGFLYTCVADFPRLSGNFRCHNAAISVLPALLHVDTREEWRGLHHALTACALLGTMFLAWRRAAGLRFRLVAFWLGVSAMPVALLHTRVYYDVYTILGGSLMLLPRHLVANCAGGLLVGLTHPEQAIIGSVSLFCVACALEVHKDRHLRGAVLGAAAGVVLTKLHGLLDPPGGLSRAGVLGRSVLKSLWQVPQTGTMALYACYGLAWLLIGAWFVGADATRKQRWLLVLGLVVFPGLVSLVTLDGTRVFVCASWPAFVLFVITLCERESFRVPLRAASCLAVLMFWFTPAYVTWGANVSRPRLGTLIENVVHWRPSTAR